MEKQIKQTTEELNLKSRMKPGMVCPKSVKVLMTTIPDKQKRNAFKKLMMIAYAAEQNSKKRSYKSEDE